MSTSLNDINQRDLFEAVEDSYFENNGTLTQTELYLSVGKKLNISPSDHYEVVGKQNRVNTFFRKCRWVQQSLKNKKLLTQVSRGSWTLIGSAKERLHTIEASKSVIAMSTSLGIMICSKAESVFDNDIIQDDEIHLVVTSPPYILQSPRNYGGTNNSKEWVEFIMSVIEKITPRLARGASIALNIGQDSFEPGMPARQTHIERLVIAMEDANFWLVDRLIWSSNKAPGPYAWTSLHRQMLRSSFEFVLHFTNDPYSLRCCNQRVLQPHNEAHKRFVRSGGTRKHAINSDGAHRKTPGDYSKTDLDKGKIPTNNLYFSNKCIRNEEVNRYARELGIPTHGAKMPYALANFLVQYMSRVGDLVLDPFSGTANVAAACEDEGRKWIAIEPIYQYICQSFIRFRTSVDEVWFNPAFLSSNPTAPAFA
jgi:DNA modification methylase